MDSTECPLCGCIAHWHDEYGGPTTHARRYNVYICQNCDHIHERYANGNPVKTGTWRRPFVDCVDVFDKNNLRRIRSDMEQQRYETEFEQLHQEEKYR